jgi:hypothetical protein
VCKDSEGGDIVQISEETGKSGSLVKRSRLVTCYTRQLGFRKSGVVSTVTILALLEGVFQAKVVKLSFANSCIRLLSKV